MRLHSRAFVCYRFRYPVSSCSCAGRVPLRSREARPHMQPFYDILRKNPELAIFLTLAIGFYIGRLKVGGFSIGSVTGVLLTGLAIGQLGLLISPAIKSVFFPFFLFSFGYRVRPPFFPRP